MKRVRCSKEFKLQVIKEVTEAMIETLVARRYDVNSNMVSRGVDEYIEM